MSLALFKLLNVYTVLLFMNHELPPDGTELDMWSRYSLATAIVEAGDGPDEWALLARIARWESFFIPKVLDCRRRSSCGASGPFQVIPRSKEEGNLICTNWVESGRLALQRVKESQTICKRLPKSEQLAQYTTGKCEELGKKLSRLRWATAKDLYFIKP